jgi:hypothetical protein
LKDGGREGIRTPGLLVANSGENKLRQGATITCYFHEALNWQTWQTGFLFVFSMQFDSEKPDKITRGACACNDDRVIFENPLLYRTEHLFGTLAQTRFPSKEHMLGGKRFRTSGSTIQVG